MKQTIIIIFLLLLNCISADISFNEVCTLDIGSFYSVRSIWYDDYDQDQVNDIFIEYNSGLIKIFNFEGELIQEITQNPNIIDFSLNSIEYQFEWEHLSVNEEGNTYLNLYLSDLTSQTIIDTLSLLALNTSSSTLDVFLNNYKIIEQDSQMIIILGFSYNYSQWDTHYDIDKLFIFNTDNTSITQINTIENYGDFLYSQTDNHLIIFGQHIESDFDMEGSTDHKDIYFGRYDLSSNTVVEILSESGISSSCGPNYSYINFPFFEPFITKENDLADFGFIYRKFSLDSSGNGFDDILCLNTALNDTLWVRNDLLCQSNTDFITTVSTLGDQIGIDKFIIFGLGGPNADSVEIIDLSSGNNLHTQLMDFFPKYIAKDLNHLYFFPSSTMYEFTDSSHVFTVDPEIVNSTVNNFFINPNPFNPTTNISFSVDEAERIVISIYNSKGQFINQLKDDFYQKGNYSITWDGRNNYGKLISSGIYFINLEINNNDQIIKKCLLLK
jgi:hypothetical protein